MRRVRYSVAASLDGLIAGPSGEFDWIPMDPDIDFPAMFREFDTLLMGRRTYEVVQKTEQGPTPGIRTIVVSRTLCPEDHPHVTILGEDVGPALDDLRRQPGKDIWLFGGGDLFRSLLDMGQVDAVEVAIVPILLGGGMPLLPAPAKSAKLRYAGQTLYPKSGILSIKYDVVKAPEGP